ncbi:hypothetical protein P152DRAFT_448002 [Eremomyces bilateralis CBS 781.70]|uniref:Mid2 domain-containing protein n=1 Tax=Eremomyces bilateralis CBS 781.70 TaxID=1392243 RepID=A0A6G1G9R0_9PEZI|nr:uncharacterized protein P152DRAFT_448002 [Eremomyces bilateralis CBS 781.70]KAF1814676.1 hypothetical protein P152DRAFT_448002 [Eremomyces bilateralis CBS 781.70]
MRLATWASTAFLLVASTMAQEEPDPVVREAMAKRQISLNTGATILPVPDPTSSPTSSPAPPPSTSSPDPPSSTSIVDPPPPSSTSSSVAPPSSTSSPRPSSTSASFSAPESSTFTSALVTSIPVAFTTTIITIDDSGVTRTSEMISSTLAASTTGFATVTGAPAVNSGDGAEPSSGLSSDKKKIIGGVVGGVGGAILLGGIAIVAWRLWGKKKQRWDEDEVWTTGRAEGDESRKPESSGATVTSGGVKSNPAANF